MKKFSTFWKLTQNDYPDYIPFKPFDKENELYNTRLSAYTQEQASERSYVALHNMLHILEDNDP